jgi:hypothetical protein
VWLFSCEFSGQQCFAHATAPDQNSHFSLLGTLLIKDLQYLDFFFPVVKFHRFAPQTVF